VKHCDVGNSVIEPTTWSPRGRCLAATSDWTVLGGRQRIADARPGGRSSVFDVAVFVEVRGAAVCWRPCSACTTRCTLARRRPSTSRTSRCSATITTRSTPSPSATGCSPTSPTSRLSQCMHDDNRPLWTLLYSSSLHCCIRRHERKYKRKRRKLN